MSSILLFLFFNSLTFFPISRACFGLELIFAQELHTTSCFINEWLMSNALVRNQRTVRKSRRQRQVPLCCSLPKKFVLIIPRNHIEKKLEVQSIGRRSFEKFIKDFELVKFRLIDDSTMKMDRKEKKKVNCLTG